MDASKRGSSASLSGLVVLGLTTIILVAFGLAIRSENLESCHSDCNEDNQFFFS
jgi:hypothetical protein